jgi:hypothetical protein
VTGEYGLSDNFKAISMQGSGWILLVILLVIVGWILLDFDFDLDFVIGFIPIA